MIIEAVVAMGLLSVKGWDGKGSGRHGASEGEYDLN
jgi:hypothetical protein